MWDDWCMKKIAVSMANLKDFGAFKLHKSEWLLNSLMKHSIITIPLMTFWFFLQHADHQETSKQSSNGGLMKLINAQAQSRSIIQNCTVFICQKTFTWWEEGQRRSQLRWFISKYCVYCMCMCIKQEYVIIKYL